MNKIFIVILIVIVVCISNIAFSQSWNTIYNPVPVTSETSTVGGVYQSGGKGNTCYIKKQSWVSSSSTATTALQTLITNTISASEVGNNGSIEYEVDISITNNANGKIILTKLGGSTASSPSIASIPSSHVINKIMSRGVPTAQFVETHLFNNASAISNLTSTMAVTTTSALSLVTQLTLSNATDTITVNGYKLAICHGD